MKWGWGSISEDGQDLDINVANQNSHVLYTLLGPNYLKAIDEKWRYLATQ